MTQEIVEAPITGTIISIEVKQGDKVEEGDVLLYIESMKMENPIMAPVKRRIRQSGRYDYHSWRHRVK